MLLSLCLFTTLLSTASWAQQPDSCSLKSFDRCGPANQRPGTPSTCNATVTPGLPAVYNVNCQRNGDQGKLNGANCLLASTDICNRLTDPHVKRDQWVWSNPSYLSCSLGFWLPSGPNGTDAAFAPDWNRCMYGIFQPMTNACTNPSWNNVGSVNLKIMPNTSTTGEAVDGLYPSYAIAPTQLTQYAF
ncbi:MAG: hypothetical protein L6R40_008269 [Gallowayella cf. fulva]|nr:MAG: hypothetical protein L6R40_008269 [Xanthomendoza cf. fulva]